MSYLNKSGGSALIVHNETQGLQGGIPADPIHSIVAEYYHLTYTEYLEMISALAMNIDGGTPGSVYGGVFMVDDGGP